MVQAKSDELQQEKFHQTTYKYYFRAQVQLKQQQDILWQMNQADLHGIEEEEHDEEWYGRAERETHRLQRVQSLDAAPAAARLRGRRWRRVLAVLLIFVPCNVERENTELVSSNTLNYPSTWINIKASTCREAWLLLSNERLYLFYESYTSAVYRPCCPVPFCQGKLADLSGYSM